MCFDIVYTRSPWVCRSSMAGPSLPVLTIECICGQRIDQLFIGSCKMWEKIDHINLAILDSWPLYADYGERFSWLYPAELGSHLLSTALLYSLLPFPSGSQGGIKTPHLLLVVNIAVAFLTLCLFYCQCNESFDTISVGGPQIVHMVFLWIARPLASGRCDTV